MANNKSSLLRWLHTVSADFNHIFMLWGHILFSMLNKRYISSFHTCSCAFNFPTSGLHTWSMRRHMLVLICATLHTAGWRGLQALFGIEQGDMLLGFSVEHCFKRALSKTLCLQRFDSVTILVWYSALSSVVNVHLTWLDYKDYHSDTFR